MLWFYGELFLIGGGATLCVKFHQLFSSFSHDYASYYRNQLLKIQAEPSRLISPSVWSVFIVFVFNWFIKYQTECCRQQKATNFQIQLNHIWHCLMRVEFWTVEGSWYNEKLQQVKASIGINKERRMYSLQFLW